MKQCFIPAIIKQQNYPPQAFEPRNIIISTDAILVFQKGMSNTYLVTLKPEYELKIKESAGIPPNGNIEYITIKNEDAIKIQSE